MNAPAIHVNAINVKPLKNSIVLMASALIIMSGCRGQGSCSHVILYKLPNKKSRLIDYVKRNKGETKEQKNGCIKLINSTKNQKILLKFIEIKYKTIKRMTGILIADQLKGKNSVGASIAPKNINFEKSISKYRMVYKPKNKNSIKSGKWKGYVALPKQNSVENIVNRANEVGDYREAVAILSLFIKNFHLSPMNHAIDFIEIKKNKSHTHRCPSP